MDTRSRWEKQVVPVDRLNVEIRGERGSDYRLAIVDEPAHKSRDDRPLTLGVRCVLQHAGRVPPDRARCTGAPAASSHETLIMRNCSRPRSEERRVGKEW